MRGGRGENVHLKVFFNGLYWIFNKVVILIRKLIILFTKQENIMTDNFDVDIIIIMCLYSIIEQCMVVPQQPSSD